MCRGSSKQTYRDSVDFLLFADKENLVFMLRDINDKHEGNVAPHVESEVESLCCYSIQECYNRVKGIQLKASIDGLEGIPYNFLIGTSSKDEEFCMKEKLSIIKRTMQSEFRLLSSSNLHQNQDQMEAFALSLQTILLKSSFQLNGSSRLNVEIDVADR